MIFDKFFMQQRMMRSYGASKKTIKWTWPIKGRLYFIYRWFGGW